MDLISRASIFNHLSYLWLKQLYIPLFELKYEAFPNFMIDLKFHDISLPNTLTTVEILPRLFKPSPNKLVPPKSKLLRYTKVQT